MIRKAHKEEKPKCVQALRRGHQTAADNTGLTRENAQR